MTLTRRPRGVHFSEVESLPSLSRSRVSLWLVMVGYPRNPVYVAPGWRLGMWVRVTDAETARIEAASRTGSASYG